MYPKSIKATQLLARLVFMTVALLAPTALQAQEARGKLSGTVKDANGAVIPNASVKVTNVAMGTTITATSNDAGLYQAPYLLPGTYQITVETTGFKKYTRDKIELRVNDALEINLQLEVGNTAESVTVSA